LTLLSKNVLLVALCQSPIALVSAFARRDILTGLFMKLNAQSARVSKRTAAAAVGVETHVRRLLVSQKVWVLSPGQCFSPPGHQSSSAEDRAERCIAPPCLLGEVF